MEFEAAVDVDVFVVAADITLDVEAEIADDTVDAVAAVIVEFESSPLFFFFTTSFSLDTCDGRFCIRYRKRYF